MTSPNPNAPCPCGSGKSYQQCCRNRNAATPTSTDRWGAGAQSRQPGQHAVGVLPVVAPSTSMRFTISSTITKGITGGTKAFTSDSGNAEMHFKQGNTFHSAEKLDEAIASYRKAIAFKPDYFEAHGNLGVALQKQGRMDEAVASYRTTLQLRPGLAETHYNLGDILWKQGKLDEAAGNYRRAISLRPDFAAAYNNLGTVLQDQEKLEEAVANYRKALALKPDYAKAYYNLGNTLCAQGKIDEALACFRLTQSLAPSNGVKVASALMLPPIMGTRAEVLESRNRFEHNLDLLSREGITLTDPCKEHCTTNFFLAYQGLNDKEIQQNIARFYEQACPSLLYQASHCAEQGRANSRLRIGFLSKFIYAHSVSACFNKIVGGLANSEDFEVALISTHDHSEKSTRNMYPDFAGAHVRLPDDLARAREMVAALKLDVLVYLDIGMEPLSYFLAFSRLARVQCVIGGHPVTTGIRNLDYFLSSALSEPENADQHYSEKLVRLPIRPSYFARPVLPAVFKTRKELGLPEQGHIYSCPMRLQKLHPDFDAAITRILQLDTGGYVVLFEDRIRPTWRGLLDDRLKRTIPAQVLDRILFLPWINDNSDFMSMNRLSDVVLDPFHFGIGTTAISTFSVGTPIVTRPSEFLRGRIGYQFCKLLGIPECIAYDIEEYAQKAVSIATTPRLRDSIRAKIMANDHLLFDNPQTIKDMAEFFLGLRQKSGTAAIPE